MQTFLLLLHLYTATCLTIVNKMNSPSEKSLYSDETNKDLYASHHPYKLVYQEILKVSWNFDTFCLFDNLFTLLHVFNITRFRCSLLNWCLYPLKTHKKMQTFSTKHTFQMRTMLTCFTNHTCQYGLRWWLKTQKNPYRFNYFFSNYRSDNYKGKKSK